MKKIFENTKVIGLLLFFIPVAIHLIVLNNFTLNFPFEDGHRVFMDFSYNFFNAKTFQEKILLIFTPDNESRPFLIRLSLLMQIGLFKYINFKTILWFANFYTVLFMFVFYKKYKENPLFLGIVSLCVLSLCNWELYFRSDVASYQLATIALSVLLFYWATGDYTKRPWYSKILFYLVLIIVPFGSAIGFIAVLLILIYAFIRKTKPHWLIISSLFLLQLLLYLNSTSTNDQSNSLFENFQKYNFELVLAYFIALGGQFQFFFNNIGYALAGTMGVLTFVCTSFLLAKNWKSKEFDFEMLLFLFSASSLAIIVLSRYNYWFVGLESILVSRYKIYGILIFIAGISFLLNNKASLVLKYLIGVLFLLIYGIWLLKSIYKLNLKNETQMIDAFNLENGMIKNANANNTYEAKFKYEYLKNKGYFNADELYKDVELMIAQSKKVVPENAVLKFVDYDPSYESDWGGKKTKLSKISVQGTFPVSKRYFIKLIDRNNRFIILNGQGNSASVAKRIFRNDKEILSLHKEFELEYFLLEKPLRCQVLCVKK